MAKKKWAAAILTFAIAGIASLASGEGPFRDSGQGLFSLPKQGKGLADRLDDLGNMIFGGILPDRDQEHPADRSLYRLTPKKGYPDRGTSSGVSPRAGSAFAVPAKRGAARGGEQPRQDGTSLGSKRMTFPEARPVIPQGMRYPSQPVKNSAPRDPNATAAEPRSKPTQGKSTFNAAGLSGLGNPTVRPIHERLRTFRESAFAGAGDRQATSAPGRRVESPTTGEPVSVGESSASSSIAPPGGNRGRRPLIPQTDPETPRQRVVTPIDIPSPTPAARPESQSPPVAEPTPAAGPRPTPAARLAATAEPRAANRQSLLIARKGPILAVETVGPRRIAVGKESVYQVTIQNSGEVAAEEVVVSIELPGWADVVGAEADTGTTQAAAPGQVSGPLEWKLGRLEAMSKECLVLRIVPRENRPFDLAVHWHFKPVVSQAMIEVQEPNLAVSLTGPREVLFGEKELYRLKLVNSGNGDADNVMITLMPLGAGGSQPISHSLGTLSAGQEKTVEVELTARQVGTLTIKVDVRGEGGVHAELAEKVLVRRAALQVEVQGPSVQYVGTVATYQVRVRNPGTAAAKNVECSLELPPGAKYVSGVDAARLVANGTKLAWNLDQLNSGSEQTFTLKCSLGLPGQTRIAVLTKAEGDLTASASTQTKVEAMADLVLDVKDPSGPVAVGQEATYELRIRNRGTKNADDVEVVGYFSRGIEPSAAEGGPHRIAPGQVAFRSIPTVPAGGELVLKIRAKAETAGNHIFRAEVHCKPLGTRLVSEETTLYYQDAALPRPASAGGPQREPSPAGSPEYEYTADRRESAAPRSEDRGPGPSTGPGGGQPTPAAGPR